MATKTEQVKSRVMGRNGFTLSLPNPPLRPTREGRGRTVGGLQRGLRAVPSTQRAGWDGTGTGSDLAHGAPDPKGLLGGGWPPPGNVLLC